MLVFSRSNVLPCLQSQFTMIICTNFKVKLRQIGMSLVLQVFGHNPKYWTNLNFDQVMVLNETFHFHKCEPHDPTGKIRGQDHQSHQDASSRNYVSSQKCCGNPSSRCGNMKTMMTCWSTVDEKPMDHQSHESSRDHECLHKI